MLMITRLSMAAVRPVEPMHSAIQPTSSSGTARYVLSRTHRDLPAPCRFGAGHAGARHRWRRCGSHGGAAGHRLSVGGLSPECKFPAQIDDVERAYRSLLAQAIRPQNIAAPVIRLAAISR